MSLEQLLHVNINVNDASNDHQINHSTTNIRDAVKTALTKYFINLDGASASNIYDLVISEVEKPLLETVMRHATNNQSKAAKWLGLSRNTLRKLLEKHCLELG